MAKLVPWWKSPVDKNMEKHLMFADKGHFDLILTLMVDQKIKNKSGQTPLFAAVAKGKIEIVEALLKASGIDANEANLDDGYTPLLAAAARGKIEVVEALASGIDVNKADHNGRTPLFMAAFLEKTEAVRALLKKPEIDVNHANINDETPLFAAAAKGKIEVVEALLKASGIDVNKADHNGRTPLFMTAFLGKIEAVKALLKARGIHADKANKQEKTPFDIAKEKNYTEIVNILHSHFIDHKQTGKRESSNSPENNAKKKRGG